MNSARRHPQPRTAGGLFTILVLSAATIVGLSQCKLINDTITGPLHGKRPRGSCFSECAQAFKDSLEAEEDLHRELRRACDDNRICRRQEHDRHEAAEDRIKENFKNCVRSCHHQGSGHGR